MADRKSASLILLFSNWRYIADYLMVATYCFKSRGDARALPQTSAHASEHRSFKNYAHTSTESGLACAVKAEHATLTSKDSGRSRSHWPWLIRYYILLWPYKASFLQRSIEHFCSWRSCSSGRFESSRKQPLMLHGTANNNEVLLSYCLPHEFNLRKMLA
jgi:hypothetical protein